MLRSPLKHYRPRVARILWVEILPRTAQLKTQLWARLVGILPVLPFSIIVSLYLQLSPPIRLARVLTGLLLGMVWAMCPEKQTVLLRPAVKVVVEHPLVLLERVTQPTFR